MSKSEKELREQSVTRLIVAADLIRYLVSEGHLKANQQAEQCLVSLEHAVLNAKKLWSVANGRLN